MLAARRLVSTPSPICLSRAFASQAGGKNTLSKTELIERLRTKTHDEKNPMSKRRFDEIINAVFNEIGQAVLVEGKEVRISKFGTFKQKNIPATERRNPKTNEKFMASPVTKLSFKASSFESK